LGIIDSLAIKLSNILYQSALAVGAGVDLLGKSHGEVTEYNVRVNSRENEADRLMRDALSATRSQS